ncbi:hypothetical protein NP493_153g00001 [Ridgeia piscesae]|uniref:Uncharacterized protein n=1 Tax=Ridgeia piscesae TaxID=27915 RepID=A0AAD9P456_RIDPI|nr:hypothetical protein NP493_153g00001 [Ridgeia piscesae]
MFTDSMLVGVHLKTSPSNMAPRGPESIVTVTSSPSGSNALTVKLLSTPSVALSTASTVIFGLALDNVSATLVFLTFVSKVAAAASALSVTAKSKRHSLLSPHVLVASALFAAVMFLRTSSMNKGLKPVRANVE